MAAPIAIQWRPRTVPLTPVAAVAIGPVARAFGERLLQGTDAQLAQLMAVAGDDLLLVLGEATTLPWVNGVTYLGRDPAAPKLLLPTHLESTVHAGLLESAFVQSVHTPPPPWAVLPTTAQLVPVGTARMLAREALWSWLAARQAA